MPNSEDDIYRRKILYNNIEQICLLRNEIYFSFRTKIKKRIDLANRKRWTLEKKEEEEEKEKEEIRND